MIDRSLPLVELHRHLDGNVRLATILDLARRHGIVLPSVDLEGLRPHVQVTEPQPGVMAFIAKFKWLTAVMVDYEAVRRIAYENIEDAHKEGIDAIELRFSPWFMAQAQGLDAAQVVEAVVDGTTNGKQDYGLKVNLIGILTRTFGPEIAFKELQALRTQRDHIRALDLAGDEAHFPAEWFREHFRRARDAGWHITVHAGEIAGPESIWEALNGLGAERIGHALSATQDAQLMVYLAEHRIGVESSLTSNVQTSCVRDYSSHPLRKYLEAGIPASINTDDPGISGINLAHEYRMAGMKAGLSKAQISQVQINALETSFFSEEEKEELRNSKHAASKSE